MKLTKPIPSRTKTIHLRWLKTQWLAITPTYREIRGRTRKPMDKCYWCKHKFIDGEMMALACVEEAGNQVLCQQCAAEAKGQPDE